MEVYNFFTEMISEQDAERIEKLKEAHTQLEETFDTGTFNLVYKVNAWSIIGQIYGDDTNVGDTDLLWIFSGIKYVWFDAFTPSINNLNNSEL